VIRAIPVLLDLAAELIQLASTEYLRKRLGITTLKARLDAFEREVDDAIARARRERGRAA
jgi:hypothetical protein